MTTKNNNFILEALRLDVAALRKPPVLNFIVGWQVMLFHFTDDCFVFM